MIDIKTDARGRWRDILVINGIERRFLNTKHTSCPLCGGKDRFRFDDKEGNGTWICNQCGAGNGISLLMKFHNIDFKATVKMIKESIGQAEYTKPREQKNEEEIRASLRELWKQSEKVIEGDIVDKYLEGRGICLRSPALRKIYKCRTSKGQMLPAMLALVTDAGGNPVTIHRTYLGKTGKAEIDTPREFMGGKIPEGSAIRLMPEGINLGIAEGIETAFSAAQLFKVPVWSALNAGLLTKWQRPEKVTNIFVFGDNDASYTGQAAAYTLANRLAVKGLSVTVIIPDKTGEDWNDVLMREKCQNVA